ncbi:MAG: heat-inducible transcriptional repressor HrcA, partial [[Eubacterium] siraeum]|nr:heat-inducible transcriptional repressor HrcA [[Eubacterium] siraeum]
MSKELSERKKRILHALVDLYISTGQPVSSSDIQSQYLPEVSSATVRSELSALEALGYIEQPHTSAGRIPLKDAYRFYVESIDAESENMLTDKETELIRSRFRNKIGQVENISKEAAKVISDMTNYTSFFIEKSFINVEIEEVKLVPLKGDKALVLIVTNKGVIANKAIDVKGDTKSEYLESATTLLNKVFVGRRVEDMDLFSLDEVDVEIQGYNDVFDEVLGILRIYLNEHSDDNVFVEGALKMLDYPEYNNIEDAKNFLSVISDKSSMSELLSDDDSSIEFSVRIGKEDSGVDKCAI